MSEPVTNSTVSAEQAREALLGLWNTLEGHTTGSLAFLRELETFITQHSTEPVAVEREAFEEWIKAPPFERRALRFPDDDERVAWPGQYRASDIQLAWEAWQESIRRRFAAQGQSVAKVPRYPWNDAPWWAEFATTDSSGRSVWHQQVPTLFGSEWYSRGDMAQIGIGRSSGRTFRDSLEQRPTGGESP